MRNFPDTVNPGCGRDDLRIGRGPVGFAHNPAGSPMIEPTRRCTEEDRLRAVRGLGLLDTPLEERFERITRLARTIFRTRIAALSLVEEQRQWFKSIQGLCVSETSRQASFCTHALHEDDLLIVPDARVDPRFAHNPLVLGPPNIVFYAGRPIRAAQGAVVGAVCVIDSEPRTLDAEERQALRDLGAIAEAELSAAMERGANDELFAEVSALKHRSRIDPLTRVWNRGATLDALDLAIQRSARTNSGVAVLMADLDHFKAVNDTHGHVAGDEVLVEVAKRMLGSVRSVDALGRFGGEEFIAVLAPLDNASQAVDIAERMRTAIAGVPVRVQGVDLALTTSVGVAFTRQPKSCAPDALIAAADDALYRAKRRGRNRVEVSWACAADAAA